MKKIKKQFDKAFWFIFLLVGAKGALFANFGINLIWDDGAYYTNAKRIISGEVIYKDFQSLFPPLNDYFVAFLVQFVSTNIVTLRLVTLLIALLLFPTFFIIGKLLTLSKWISLFIATLPFLAALRPEVLYIHSIFYLGFLFLLIFIWQKHKLLLLLSGLLLALGFWLRIDTGVYFTITAAVVVILSDLFLRKLVLRKTLADLFILFIPLALSLVVVFLVLLQKGLMMTTIQQIVVVPINITSVIKVNLVSLNNLLNFTLNPKYLNKTFEGWVYIGFMLVYISSIVLVFKSLKKKIVEQTVVLVGLITLVTLAIPYLFGRMDIGHLLKGGMAYFLLGGYVFMKTKSKILKWALAGYAIAIFLGFLAISFWWLSFNYTRYSFGDKGALFLNSRYVPNSTRITGKTLQSAADFLKSSENEYVFAAPYMSSLYYLSNKKSPVLYDSLINKYIFEPYNEEYVVREIVQKRVDHIVYDREKGPDGESSAMKNYYPIIDDYLMKNFEVIQESKDGWLFMQRKNE